MWSHSLGGWVKKWYGVSRTLLWTIQVFFFSFFLTHVKKVWLVPVFPRHRHNGFSIHLPFDVSVLIYKKVFIGRLGPMIIPWRHLWQAGRMAQSNYKGLRVREVSSVTPSLRQEASRSSDQKTESWIPEASKSKVEEQKCSIVQETRVRLLISFLNFCSVFPQPIELWLPYTEGESARLSLSLLFL